MAKTHIASEETLQRIAVACERSADAAAQSAGMYRYPVWDDVAGEYTNESIKGWLDWNSDGKLYGVDQPLDAVQTCTKVLANAGIPNPVPSTFAAVGSDPYWQLGPFRWIYVNGYFDDDGVPHVTGMEPFGHFSWDRDVWALTPVRYVSQTEVGGCIRLVNSDRPAAGLSPEERSTLKSGELSPYMMRAAFIMSLKDGIPMTVPYAKTALFSVSHNSLITSCKLKGAAYSGLTAADDAYLYDMYLLKYANKSSQTVFAGCTSHTEQTFVTVAGEGVSTVTVAASAATNWPIGSCIEIGTATSVSDRNNANSRDIASQVNILAKAVDGDNIVLTLDCDPINTPVGCQVSTMPWNPGACIGIQYDGSPTNCKSGREPFVLQGIETGMGCYEILGDEVAKGTGTEWELWLASTTDKCSTSAPTADYVRIHSLGSTGGEGWKYPKAQKKSHGAYVPTEFGASTSTGTGDGIYMQSETTTGSRCFLARGHLWHVGIAGLRSACLSGGLSWTWWSDGSRVSGNGLNGVSAA